MLTKWINSLRPDGVIVWADLTKSGRLQKDDFDNITEAIRNLLQHNPSKMSGVIIVPVLPSDRVAAGIRGEATRA